VGRDRLGAVKANNRHLRELNHHDRAKRLSSVSHELRFDEALDAVGI
jgi:hypothetical protein